MSVDDFARLGRLHPLVLHLPIGLVFAVFVLELGALRGIKVRPAQGPLLVLAALFALVAAGSGWILGHEDGYGGETFERHQRLGLAVAAATTTAALLFRRAERSPLATGLYRVALATALALLVPAGHLGATLTHGEDWLDGPRKRAKPVPADSAPRAEELAATPSGEAGTPSAAGPAPAAVLPDTYATVIEPILAAYCTNCHGTGKHKGDLRLHTPEAIAAGGESGPALVAGDLEQSLLYVRAALPLEHEDHMPPEGKAQPRADELAALAAWIRAGAPFTGHVELGLEVAPPAPRAVEASEAEAGPAATSQGSAPAPALAPAPSAPSSELLAALDAAFVHHEALPGEEHALWIDVAAVAPSFDGATFAGLVVPLAPWTVELSLARAPLDDAALAALSGFSRLRKLDLRATRLSSAGLAVLRGHATLSELVLSQTALDDGALDVLLSLPALRKLTAWRSGLSSEALARLANERPQLVVVGAESAAVALESEGELAFSSDRPLPGYEDIPAEQRPINTKCPVSDSPVNPKYTVVHEGRVIGFCCPNCPGQFTAEPAKFAAKLP